MPPPVTALTTLASDGSIPVELAVVLAIALLLAAALGLGGVFRGSTLRRGPLREIEWGPTGVAVGLALVALFFLDKLLLGVGGHWIAWPEDVALGIKQVAGLGLLIGPMFFVFKASMTDAGLRKAGLLPRRPGRDVFYATLGLVVGMVFTFATLAAVNAAATWAGRPSPPVNHGTLTQLQDMQHAGEFSAMLLIIVMAVVIGPLLEELVFRGLLQSLLLEVFGRASRWAVILTAAAVFASIHLGATTWHALPGLFVLGAVLGWLYERTGSLLPAVLAHAGFNAFNIAWVLAFAKTAG